MTLSGSLSNAISGLTASSRAVEVVSNNVANALTDGYATRNILLSSRAYGNGVQVDGVQRNWDPVLLGDRRLAEAEVANSSTQHSSLQRIEASIGLPSDASSLSSRLASFDTALIEANSRPESEARLGNVVRSAQALTNKFNEITVSLQGERMNADQSISAAVSQLNDGLEKVQVLNKEIIRFTMTGNDINGLVDQRQQVIDTISSIIPVKQIEREFGRVALFTPGGAVLIDGPPAAVGFSQTGTIVADMSIDSGALSGLTINDREVRVGGKFSPIAGGQLAALFAVRDEIAPKAQEGLDSLARNIIERFQDTGVDTTLTPTDAGLFTDAGGQLDSLNEIGLAGRISINSLVVAEEGGEPWRIRDGLNATSSGDVGNASLIIALSQTLHANITPTSGPFSTTSSTSGTLYGTFLSSITADRLAAEQEQQFDSTRFDALRSQELQEGVDTDDQMQKLLLIERAYAANARVVSTIDELLDELLRI